MNNIINNILRYYQNTPPPSVSHSFNHSIFYLWISISIVLSNEQLSLEYILRALLIYFLEKPHSFGVLSKSFLNTEFYMSTEPINSVVCEYPNFLNKE